MRTQSNTNIRLSSFSRGLMSLAVSISLGACAAPMDEEEASTEGEAATKSEAVKNGVITPNGVPTGGTVRVEFWDYDEQKWRICSGQIVGPRALVTAAHCPNEAGFPGTSGTWPVQVFRQLSGQEPVNLLGGWVYATLAVHADYVNSYDFTNDVAVVKIGSNWPGVTASQAALISKGTQNLFNAWVVGYGNYNTGYNDYDGRLRGKEEYIYYEGVDPKMYNNWAAGNEPWLCIGDSGGPLLSTYLGAPLMYGVASYIEYVTGYCGQRGFWSSTAENWSWISQKVGNCQDRNPVIDCWN